MLSPGSPHPSPGPAEAARPAGTGEEAARTSHSLALTLGPVCANVRALHLGLVSGLEGRLGGNAPDT